VRTVTGNMAKNRSRSCQQILFFRELDFSLDEIKTIMARPDFDAVEALQSHKALLQKRKERIDELLNTITKTIKNIKGAKLMEIKEYYQGFSDEQIEKYREEVKRRWGEKTLKDSEDRVKKMGKEKFAAVQAESDRIFHTIADNLAKGADSKNRSGRGCEMAAVAGELQPLFR